jgi:hypothetical protein
MNAGYYLPKRRFVRCYFEAPEKELQALLATDAAVRLVE